MPRFASLATRSAALYSALVGAAVILAGWLIHSGNRSEVLASRERDLEHRAHIIQVRIETEVRAVANDALFLAKAPFLRRVADEWHDSRPPRDLVLDAQGIFAALLEGKPSYAQTRLLRLSGAGNEIIRLDHANGSVIACPPEGLQSKGHRDYFQESASLKPGEVYFSRINLNQEFGAISVPHTPTLRVAAKVFDSTGAAFGLIVINVDLRPLFSQLRAAAGTESSLYIANHDGDYLVHPQASRTFGFDLGERHRVQDDFGPEPVRAARSPDEIVRFVRFPLQETASPELLVGVGVPRARVLSELTAIRNRSLAAAMTAALLAALLVWGLAFLLSRRLTTLADTIGRFEPGRGAPVLPVRGRDEVAVVARKFASLSAEIDETVAALEAARRLADENRLAKEEFLATLSHEIRTPMNSVTGLLHNLATDHPGQHQRPILDALQFASRKLIAVVNDVLDFSKIEAGQLSFERSDFDLHELLDRMRTAYLSQAREGQVEFLMRQDPELPRFVRGDSLRLYQILNNLIHNALKFTAPGGTVTVEIAVAKAAGGPDRGATLRFTVRDTGVGMTAEELNVALVRFGQAQPATTRKFGGTGLGLPIARMLVESQGGRFAASSTPGVGSAFAFELRFDLGAVGPELSPSSPPDVPDLAGTRILCVEDVASNRQVVEAFLAPSGAALEFAANAAETIDSLARQRPDLVLLDLQLPDRDGATLAREIRGRWPDLTVIGLTAQTSGSLLERCREAGVTTYLWKPIDPEPFFRTIAAALTRGERGSAAPRADVNPAPVELLFDGDPHRCARYFATLAAELEEAAAALPALTAARDHEGLRALHHRLRNGLTLIEATTLLESLDRLSASVSANAPSPEAIADETGRDLLRTARELRDWRPERSAAPAG